MNDVLSRIESEADAEQVSLALRQLYGRFFKQTEDQSEPQCHEEIFFDFFMEDGIQIVSTAIRREDLDAQDIYQGLKLMFQAGQEHACHMQCIWDSMGRLDGIIHFLEIHCTNESIFTSILKLCTNLSQSRLLGVEAKEILRWMPLWDLLLCGVESCSDQSQVFFSFCHLLESQKDELVPVEMRGRIRCAIIRGIEILHLRAPENQPQMPTSKTLLSRFSPDHDDCTSGVDMIGTGSKSLSRCMFIPCSAAA